MRNLLLLAALCIPVSIAQTLPDGDALVKQEKDAFKNLKSVKYDAEIKVDVSGGPAPTNMTGQISMAIKNPGRMRLETKMMGFTISMISDGESTYAYNSMSNQYVKQNAAFGPDGIVKIMGLQGSMPDLTKIKMTSKTLRADTIELDGQKRDCWVVETKVDKMDVPQMPGAQVSNMLMTTWIDQKTGMDLRSDTSMSIQLPAAAGGMKMDQKIAMVKKSLVCDGPIPDSLFALTPPAGATETDTLLGSTLPKGELAGKDAPAFDVKGLDAKPYSLAALKGKPVLLDFWATWCGPCRKSLPVVEKIAQDYKDLVVVSVDAGEDRATVEEFLKKNPMPFPVILGGDGDIVKAYSVSAFP